MLFVVTGTVLTISSLISFIKRDWVAVHKKMGIKSLDEQIEEES